LIAIISIFSGQDMRFFFRYGSLLPVVGFLLTILFPLNVHCKEEPRDLDSYRKECANGKTIYCIAIGMEEQKSGNLETALKAYQSACESHPSQGHLKACTPLLSLARQMDRLDEASAGLEALCKGGDDIVCFYLAKEYFKITEYHRGFVHLERLCREDFRSPEKADYGPCFHLGNNLKKIGKLKRARKIFNFDCDRDPGSAKPSCDQLEEVRFLIRQGKANGGKSVIEFARIEVWALGIAAIPLLGLLLLNSGWKFALIFLWIPAPALTFFCWALWEPHAKQGLDLRADLHFIAPAVFLTLLTAWSAHRKLQLNPSIG
jgi:tetratricopeptide (TPR) repeat protein